MASTIHVVNTSRSDLSRRFQINGLNVRAEALSIFEAEVKHGDPPYESIDDFIGRLCDVLLKMSTENYIIDSELAQKAVDLLREERRSECSNNQTESIVIKNVNIDEDNKTEVAGGSNFKHHYNQLLKALKRLPVFENGQFSLTKIEELNIFDISSEFKCILFAMIRRDPSKIMQYFLEDPTGKLPVTFNPKVTNWREWATFENGIYLVEGTYDGQNDSFLINSIGLPPPVAETLPKPELERLIDSGDDSMMEPPEQMVVMLCDIHLDDPKTIEALKFLFTGYNSLSDVPDIFVLIGDFVSKPVDQFDFKDYMKNLIKLISTFKRLANNSRFVFVPGPNDYGETISAIVKNNFTSTHFPTTTNKLKHYNLATNPFYLQIKNKNMCIFGHSGLMNQLGKNVIQSKEKFDPNRMFKKDCGTNKDQHMQQFMTSLGKLVVSSVHLTTGFNRSFDSSLSLFPRVPQVILLADNQFQQSHQSIALYDRTVQFGTLCSFSRNNFQFLVYYVNTDQLEESQISV